MINVLMTFDYELPLGGLDGSFSQTLFDPGSKLLALAQNMNVPLNFFADILCYQRFKELGRTDFTSPFEKQLQESFSSGHDVQLHLHPHWMETEIEGNKFYPSGNYGLHCFANRKYPENIEGIVEKGVEGLSGILQAVGQSYSCVAYRGGGYLLNPATAQILNALYKNGIRIDSSIGKGYFFKSDRSIVDYTNIPDKANWFLNMQGDLKKENIEKSGIFEIPIASKPKDFFEMPTAFKLKKLAHRAPINRGIMVHQKPESMGLKEKIKSLLSHRMLTFDNYTYSLDYPIKILNHFVKRYYKSKPIYLCTVSHPKSMGEYSFKMMEHFVKETTALYGGEVNFTTYSKVYNDLKTG